MIKHIVCFKLKDNSLEECEKAANILKFLPKPTLSCLIKQAPFEINGG